MSLPAKSTCLHTGTGQFFAMPYHPEEAPFSGASEQGQLEKTASGKSSTILRIDDLAETGKLDQTMNFTRCWFFGQLKFENISNWTFEECTFDRSTWEQVKFARCVFRRCHFYKATFSECSFMNSCKFESNSASPETLAFKDSQINPESFINNITTNLDNLPEGVTRDYQLHRLVRTKANLARLLFASTRNEPNREIYGSAYKTLVLNELEERIEEKRYFKTTDSRNEQKRNKWDFRWRAIGASLEKFFVRIFGFLTNWGRSLMIPALAGLVLILAFGFIYGAFGLAALPEESKDSFNWWASFFKAANITIVAGYSAYLESQGEPGWEDYFEFGNLVLGVFWYSLLVPVIARRVLR